tara:strand:- start:252 stop:416 length:165 start_codon:yes stop_codon:yes gene_type:complete
MSNQRFRFCCDCIRMSLIKDDGCYFCGGKFLITTPTDDFRTRKKDNAESYESVS